MQLVAERLAGCRKSMGGTQSSEAGGGAADELTALFDAKELKELRRVYARLANSSTGTLDAGCMDALAPGFPWPALWRAMAKLGEPVRWQDFLSTVAAMCKGRRSDRIAAVADLYKQGEGLLTSESLLALLRDAEVAARGGDASAPSATSILEAVVKDVILHGGHACSTAHTPRLHRTAIGPGPPMTPPLHVARGSCAGTGKSGAGGALVVDAAAWAAWVRVHAPSLPSAHELYLLARLTAEGRTAAGAPSPGGEKFYPLNAGTRAAPLPDGALASVQEPLLLPAAGQEEGHELLEPTCAWLLSLALGPAGAAAGGGAQQWRCLYASRTMGLSMNRFAHHAGDYGGPTLLLVLTEHGEHFGAYLDTPLKASDKFTGGASCVLFTLTPTFHVFRATNISKNFVLYNPPQTGTLASTAYFKAKDTASAPEVLGFGGQLARLRLSLEEDMNVLRWHHSCTTYAAHPEAATTGPAEGPRKVRALELWGCGGADADAVMRALKERRVRDAGRAGKVDRAAMFGMSEGGWRSEDNPDRMILETAGAHTFYSSQLEKIPDKSEDRGD